MKYALINNAQGCLENIVLWDGDESKWQPPAGTSAVPLDQVDFSTLPQKPVELPTYTAEQWVAQDYAGQRPTTLLYLKLQLDAAQKSSPKLSAVQAWLDGMIVAGVMNPDQQRSDWPQAPWTFEAASQEALAVLQS